MIELTVVGSINLDLVARVERLPRPGETLAAAAFERIPGGKGANQAVAAARLGARVQLIGAVGDDALAEEALAGLREAAVQLEVARTGETGLALILVDAGGENQIVVVPGANAAVRPHRVEGAVLCQLEVPDEVVRAAARGASFFALNAAPARPIDVVPDLLIVNRLEHEVVSDGDLVAVTFGAEGAALYEDGREVARAAPPPVDRRRRDGGRRRVRSLPGRLAARRPVARGSTCAGVRSGCAGGVATGRTTFTADPGRG